MIHGKTKSAWIAPLLAALLSAIPLAGCGRAKPANGEAAAPAAVKETSPGREAAALAPADAAPGDAAAGDAAAGDAAAVRAAVEACGGQLECDAKGRPLQVDLALARVSMDTAAFEAAIRCKTLTVLRARAPQLTADQLREIATLESLEELFLQDAPVDDAILDLYAGRLRNLRKLTLRNTPGVTDEGIACLPRFPKLAQLGLLDQQITGAAVKRLAAIPSLALLDLRMAQGIRGNDFAPLAEAPELIELKVAGYGIDDAALAVLAAMPRLRHLTVEDAGITGEGLARLAQGPAAPRIESLTLARCAGLTDEACAALARFPGLRSLALRDVPVTGTFLAGLPALDRLELLALNQTYLADEAFDAIARCRSLKRLELAGNFPTAASMEKIASLERLEYLNLTACGLTDAAIAPLGRLAHLRVLVVDSNPDLSEKAVQAIGRNAKKLGP